MTLMRILVDKRTNAGLASNVSVSFAHGLPAAPDSINVRFLTTIASNISNAMAAMEALGDGTNVTIRNGGATTSPSFEVVSMVFHTMIQ